MLIFLALTLPLNAEVALAASKNQSNLGTTSSAIKTTNSNTNSYNIDQISSAAASVTNYYTTNNKLPNYVTISNQQVSMPQFLYILASGTSQIESEGSAVTIPNGNINPASSPIENLSSGNIQKSEYKTLASNMKSFIDINGRLPNYLTTSLGKMRYESSIIMFSKILNFYNTNQRMPNYVSVTPWSGQVQNGGNTSNPPDTISQAQIIEAATNMKSYVEFNSALPHRVNVAGQQLTIPQFIQVTAQGLININSGNTSSLTTATVNPATMPVENITPGKINKSEYLNLALNLVQFTNSNNRIPNYMNTSLGQMRYETILNIFIKALDFYNTNQRLPNYITVSPWTGSPTTGEIDPSLRPIYIESDNINNKATDNYRIDLLVNALNSLGATAYNCGVGLDNYSVLYTTPANALIVYINGGACAGTFVDFGSSYYKNLLGSRKVFMVFTEGAKKITGLAWLERAHDDNFSPPSFTGLANPDQYLLSNGYNYYEGYTNSLVNELAQILYQAART